MFVILLPVTFVAHGFALEVLTLSSVNPWSSIIKTLFGFRTRARARYRVDLCNTPVVDSSLTYLIDFTDFPDQYAVVGGELVQEPIIRKTEDRARQLSQCLTRHVRVLNSANKEDLRDEQGRVRNLFFNALCRHDYERGAIAVCSPLECVLDEEVFAAHDEADIVDPITQRRVRETVLETLFSLRLGVRPEKAPSDYHQVFYLCDRSRERLGVFKPKIEKYFGFLDCCGASEMREGHLAEVATFKSNEFLEVRVVPYTQLLTCELPPEFSTMTGSYQFYVKDALFLHDRLEGRGDLFDPNHETLRERLDTPANRGLRLTNFEEFALLDLLTANNDHHFRNIFVKPTGELVAIDNANSFPWCHLSELPFYKRRPLHSYKWNALPQAQSPFGNVMVERINNLQIESFEEILRPVLVEQATPSSKDHIEGKMRTFRERYAVIRRLANEGASMTRIAATVLVL